MDVNCKKGIVLLVFGALYQSVPAQGLSQNQADNKPEGVLTGFEADTPSGPDGLMLDCLLEPYMVVNLGSPVAGVLETVNVKRGDVVKKNALVAKLNTDAETAAVEAAKARVEFTERTLERNQELYEGDLLPEQKQDEVLTESVLSKLTLRESQALLERRVIRSPINGVVTERIKAPGDFVQETEIVRIAQIDPLNVEVVVPVEFFGSIRKGMLADVMPAEPIGGSLQAKVTVVDQVIDAASGTFGVRLELPNPELKIPAGLQCSVLIPEK